MGLFSKKPKIWKPGREIIVPTPEASGVYGTQNLDHMNSALIAAGLREGWGKGIPVLESLETGAVQHYVGENSLTCWANPGGGKFTDLIARVVIECAATHSQLIIDSSGGQIAATTIDELRRHARVIVFSPFSEGLPAGLTELLGPSRSLNSMLCLLNPRSSAYGVQCDGLADMVNPDGITRGTDNGGFFVGRARGLTSGVIMFLRAHGTLEQQNLAEVARIVLTRRIYELARAVMARSDVSPYIKDRLGPYAALTAEMDRTTQAILQTADEGLSFLSNEAISDVVRLSSLHPEEMKQGARPTVILVTMPVTMLRKCRGWFGLMLSTFLQVLNNSPRGRWPVLVTCDELGILPKQPLVEQAYAESRKKGVQLFCFFQHTGQTVEIYGETGLTNFESGSDVTIYFNSELETAKRVSERAGRGTAVVPQFSFGKGGPRGNRIERNLSFGEQPFDVLTPQQVMALDRYRAVVFVRGAENANALLLGRRPYFDTSRPAWQSEEHARLRRIVAPDPYHQKKAL